MTQHSQGLSPVETEYRALRSRAVLPDEIDQDPPAVRLVPGETNSFGGPLPPAVRRWELLDALHDPQVLPDEIDQDPKQGDPAVGQLLGMFADAVRAANTVRAQSVVFMMAQNSDVMAEVIVAACRDFNLDVGE
jgi:hypothetical protein